jgi:hypothetical protein
MYRYIFESGVAKIVDDVSGHMIVHQPFNPTFNGPQPWQNESEAFEWLDAHYGSYRDYQPIEQSHTDQDQGE